MKAFEEAQKSYFEILNKIHKKIYNALTKYGSEDIKKDLVEILEDVFDEMTVIKKDINISESDTCNNNSL